MHVGRAARAKVLMLPTEFESASLTTIVGPHVDERDLRRREAGGGAARRGAGSSADKALLHALDPSEAQRATILRWEWFTSRTAPATCLTVRECRPLSKPLGALGSTLGTRSGCLSTADPVLKT